MDSSNLLVNIPISIDTKAIEEMATKAIVRDVENRVTDDFFRERWGGVSKAQTITEGEIKRVLEEHQDEIVTKAAVLIADKLCRSSKFREKVAGEVNDI